MFEYVRTIQYDVGFDCAMLDFFTAFILKGHTENELVCSFD